MAYDFPSSPTNGQTYTPAGGQTYTWDAAGSKWTVTGTGLTGLSGISYRNMCINGDFSVDQHNNGGAQTATGPSTTWTIDRWLLNMGQAPGAAVMWRSPISSITGLIGEYHMVVQPTVADASLATTDYYLILHRIEGNVFRGANWGSSLAKPVTVSFNIIGTPGPFTIPISFCNSAGNRRYSTTFTATSTDSRVAIVIPGDTTGTWLYDNGVGMEITITLGAGSSYNTAAANTWGTSGFGAASATNFMGSTSNILYFRDFQVEVGNGSTPFERIPYMDQLARCQRYFWKKVAAVPLERVCTGYCFSTTTSANVLRLPVKMRATPTFLSTGLQANGVDSTAVALSAPSDEVLSFNTIVGGTPFAIGDGSYVSMKSALDYIHADAEL